MFHLKYCITLQEIWGLCLKKLFYNKTVWKKLVQDLVWNDHWTCNNAIHDQFWWPETCREMTDSVLIKQILGASINLKVSKKIEEYVLWCCQQKRKAPYRRQKDSHFKRQPRTSILCRVIHIPPTVSRFGKHYEYVDRHRSSRCRNNSSQCIWCWSFFSVKQY